MTKKAVLYARVSGDDRGKDGRNLEGQQEMNRRYALEQGYTIIDEINEDDRGARGADFDLPGLNKALDMARNGEIDVLIVRELDRFARGLAKQLVVEQQFKRAGVDIEYVLGEYPDTPEGSLMKNIRAVIAEYERLKIAERTDRALRNMVKKGRIMLHGNAAPYGYRVSEDRMSLIPHEAEARIIRLIFQWYVEGDETGKHLTSIDIAKRLSDMRVPTWQDLHGPFGTKKKLGYGQWSATVVLGVLHKEVYKGVWHYGKRHKKNGVNPREKWIAVDVPALVSAEMWEKAQERCKRNRIMATRRTKHKYLMQYLLTCQRCGSAFGANTTTSNGKYYSYYVCYGRSNHKQRATEKCELPFFRSDHLDAAVWAWIRELLLDPVALSKGLKREQEEREQANQPLIDRVAAVESLIAENRTQLERLLDLYLAGDFDKELLKGREQELRKTVDTLEAERSGLIATIEQQAFTDEQIKTIQGFAAEVSKGLDHADNDFAARRRIIEALNVQATLAVEDEQKVAFVRCMLDQEVLSIDTNAPESARI